MTAARLGIWYAFNAAFLFGISDRSIASFADGYLSAIDLIQLSTASLCWVACMFLKPGGDRA
jgi:hypothetical protein